MLPTTALFLVGIALLYYGADGLVRGAVLLADHLRLPKGVVGLTLVALGTSSPELFVNVLAAVNGQTDFALANVSGSNLANVCLGFGFCGLLGGITIRRSEFGVDSLVALGTAFLVVCMFLVMPNRSLTVWAILPLSIVLALYSYSICRRGVHDDDQPEIPDRSFIYGVFLFLAGIFALYFGGEFVLKAAVRLAQELKIGKDVIALTIVAFGTSVPDISATVMAARRQEYGIAVGNILGSNISNILLVLNSTLLVCRYSLPTTFPVRIDYFMVCVVTGSICVLTYSSERLNRSWGWWLILTYCGYIACRVMFL